MKSLRARVDRLERRLAQRGERNYQTGLELFGRSVDEDEKAFEEWTAIVIADRSEETARTVSPRASRGRGGQLRVPKKRRA
jgi:hypothetical protein